jgi:hypothetical protein
MKTLPIQFRHDGRTLRQMQRTCDIAIYELISDGGITLGYEVIKITIRKETEAFGKILAEREYYPCDSKFGSLGWSFGTNQKRAAVEKFDMLVRTARQSLSVDGIPTVLAKEFRHAGRVFTQLKRQGRVAMYQLSGAGIEVVVIQRRGAGEVCGRWYPDREVMPDVSNWGVYGWSYLATDLAGAERRYQSLLRKWGNDSLMIRAERIPAEMELAV